MSVSVDPLAEGQGQRKGWKMGREKERQINRHIEKKERWRERDREGVWFLIWILSSCEFVVFLLTRENGCGLSSLSESSDSQKLFQSTRLPRA